MDGIRWKRKKTLEKSTKFGKKQPAYEIKNATEQIKIELKIFVERLLNAANARNIC